MDFHFQIFRSDRHTEIYSGGSAACDVIAALAKELNNLNSGRGGRGGGRGARRGRGGGAGRGGGTAGGSGSGKAATPSNSFSGKCFHCGQTGHRQRDCPQQKEKSVQSVGDGAKSPPDFQDGATE